MADTHRHIFITGASSGIGRALALGYSEPGRRLTLAGRDAARLEAVAEDCRGRGAEVEPRILDVRDRATTDVAVREADDAAPLDLVIASAGITTGLGPGRLLETPESVRAIFAVNVDGVLNTAEPALEAMTRRGRGRIAFLGSIAGVRPLPYSPAYCATKAAVHAYAGALRAGLSDKGVGVTLIAPGFVRTPLNAAIDAPRPFEVDDETAARIIRRGLDKGRDLIAFPWIVYAGARLLDLLPARPVDWVMRRMRVDIPETAERAGAGRR